MEHFKAGKFRFLIKAWIGVICLSILWGCRSPEEHPENLDPIFSDFTAQSAGIQAKAEAQKKKIEELSAKLKKYGARDPDAKSTLREKENLERGVVLMEQDVQYFSIRADQRRLYDKESYMKAFSANQPWPPAEDAADYKESKKLRNASRDWEKTVPADRTHNKPVAVKKKKEEKKGE